MQYKNNRRLKFKIILDMKIVIIGTGDIVVKASTAMRDGLMKTQTNQIECFETILSAKTEGNIPIVGVNPTPHGTETIAGLISEAKLQNTKSDIPYNLTMIHYSYIPQYKKYKGHERPYKYHK